jgi:two-component system osmolarity sensor histidine kinase EnvZ
VAASEHIQPREFPLALKAVGRWLSHRLAELMPKGLYARVIIIIIAPIVLLECVVAFVFMERHYQAVTRRLSEATARDVGAIVDLYRTYPFSDNYSQLIELARDRLNLSLQVLPSGDLPAARPKPFFGLLDRTLSNEIRKQVVSPFWIDTVGQSRHVEIRIKQEHAVLRLVATRSQTFASNSHIFLLWMGGSSVFLLTIAVLFMRNQIRPILRLAEAAEDLGRGRPISDEMKPRGAREVRQAAQAFLEMRERILQHVEQRTTMLAGVSHDLRTVLTRFKLELAMLGDSAEIEDLKSDVNEMQHMLEDYLAFARGDGGEEAKPTNIRELLEEVCAETRHLGTPISLELQHRRRDLVMPLKRQAFKRAVINLLTNAARMGDNVVVSAASERKSLRVEVNDDGPGLKLEERTEVFKPFYRLDHARNQADGNTGLGLAIALDIVRGHGGEIVLDDSPMGGLRAIIRIPL